MIKKCLTIAGSDCSGGAGIQGDLKTFSAHGCYGASVVTSVVAENTSRVISTHNLSVKAVEDQIDAIFEDIEIDAVKLGMLPTAEIAEAVAERLKRYNPAHIVCDPILAAAAGYTLISDDAAEALRKYIFPIADVITPNIPETEVFTGIGIQSAEDMERAARALVEGGAKAALIKGGHFTGDARDILFDGEQLYSFVTGRLNNHGVHGTGCTLSSAITANLAHDYSLREAIKLAKDYVTKAIRHSFTVGKGQDVLHHFYHFWS